jgi:hypothetical protein
VLAAMEKKTKRTFDGDVWKFVDQARDIGIANIEAPAKRPQVDDALKELAAMGSQPATVRQ